ncbi:MAG: formylglycine-generating enzyme family protein [Thermodesulfobacteriota bacterium]
MVIVIVVNLFPLLLWADNSSFDSISQPNNKDPGPNNEMVYISAGEFIMGSNTLSVRTKPERKVFVKAFYIDHYEVTNSQYKRFIDSTGHEAPDLSRISDEDFNRYAKRFAWRNGSYLPDRKYHPVQYVNFNDAVAYCKWAKKRLPEEEEWEKAARGSDGRNWPWGDTLVNEIVNTGSSGIRDTTEVDFFPSGMSPYGVYGMAGNVWEWVDTPFKPYPGSTAKTPDFEAMTIRGGSWESDFNFSQTAYRDFSEPEVKKRTIGFRCAKDAD